MPNRVYALLVGINDYGPDIESLDGCLNDVDFFRASGGVRVDDQLTRRPEHRICDERQDRRVQTDHRWKPASSAYAIATGNATAATESPAGTSSRSHSLRYSRSMASPGATRPSPRRCSVESLPLTRCSLVRFHSSVLLSRHRDTQCFLG